MARAAGNPPENLRHAQLLGDAKKQATSIARSGLEGAICRSLSILNRDRWSRLYRNATEGIPYRTAPSTGRLFLSSLSKFVTRASVVSSRAAMLAALLRAVRTTFTGSM